MDGGTATPARRPLAETVPSLVDAAQDFVREQILAGEYPPGHRLKEHDLAQETGISRIPIREALRALSAEGFVTLVPRRGAIVTELNSTIVEEIFEIRLVLEPFVTGLAAERATEEQLEQLLSNVELADTAMRDGVDAVAHEAKIRFHEIMIGAGQNRALARMVQPVKNLQDWVLRLSDHEALSNEEHREIAEAVAARDAERAVELARKHVLAAKKVAMETVERRHRRELPGEPDGK
ncbi:MAG TPA: GntR family transcriptional regulator [Actinomycetaceae bacterium]|nr:GntR family transcriptional regulator [Actinomycetaceae bacterium]